MFNGSKWNNRVVIIAAIIGAVATILTPVIANILLSDKNVQYSHDLLEDIWIGSEIQNAGTNGETLEFDSNMNFKVNNNNIYGIYHVKHKDNTRPFSASYELSGKFTEKRLIKLDYINKDRSIRQYGVLMLKLSDDGKTLSGFIMGYSIKYGKLGMSEIKLTRGGK